MNTTINNSKAPAQPDFRFIWFSELLKRRVCIENIKHRAGKLTDLVFCPREPYAEAVGIYLDHGWGNPTEFIPWAGVTKIDDDAIFVKPPERGGHYSPYEAQPGWIMANENLMGQTVLDTDGRRVEVVNDVHLLESKGRLIIVHVDISFNGFLRKWGLGWLNWVKDQLISWKFIQLITVEETTTDTVSLNITKKQIKEMPSEDIADALEMLSGEEQSAYFSSLDSEKAAEALVHTEPRAQRQLIANLRKDRAKMILSEMSVPQLADLFSVLPYQDAAAMMELLPPAEVKRIKRIMSEHETTASSLMSTNFMTFKEESTVGEVLKTIRGSHVEPHNISYLYILSKENILAGVVDLRELLLAADDTLISKIMASPVVTLEETDIREDISELFAKYHFHMIPVVDAANHLLGIIYYNDIML